MFGNCAWSCCHDAVRGLRAHWSTSAWWLPISLTAVYHLHEQLRSAAGMWSSLLNCDSNCNVLSHVFTVVLTSPVTSAAWLVLPCVRCVSVFRDVDSIPCSSANGSACPLHLYLGTPFPNSATTGELAYRAVQRKIRRKTERAFGNSKIHFKALCYMG